MPGTGTDRQSFRYDADKWQRFRELATPNASTVLQSFIDWYIGEPKTRAPRRPQQQAGSEQPAATPP